MEVLPMAKKKKRTNIKKITSGIDEKPIAKRAYKDNIFRRLFSDKENLLSLYNAINESDYTEVDEFEIVTLDNAIYMGVKNDLSFIIDTNIFLYEHQSTYNPNMPLRDLFYISAEYQKIVDDKSIYSSKLQKIPAPSFVVFYNGIERNEDRWENYLSESYENLNGEPNLELKVITLNINDGHNVELMKQCRILREYAQYVARVRKYGREMPLDDAVRRAVDECIKEGILADFLRKNRAEVIEMSIFEYDKEEEERKLRRAEYEAGLEDGIEQGIEQGIDKGCMETKREIANQLRNIGMNEDKIASVLNVSVEDIRKWIK